jgi:hypothetical protein
MALFIFYLTDSVITKYHFDLRELNNLQQKSGIGKFGEGGME